MNIFQARCWRLMAVMVALRKLRQDNLEFKDSLGYIVRPWLKK
jgi:hypothetical protein